MTSTPQDTLLKRILRWFLPLMQSLPPQTHTPASNKQAESPHCRVRGEHLTCSCQHKGIQLPLLQHPDPGVDVAAHRHDVEVGVCMQQLRPTPQAAGADTGAIWQVR